jgi:multiple sugar transport system substrate-binding protein
MGTEAAAAISGAKPIDQTLSDMERRVNAVLDNL